MTKNILPSQFYDLNIAAGASSMLPVRGEYFKLMSVTSAVTIRAGFGTLTGLVAGQGLENTPFESLLIENPSGSTNTVRIFIGDRNFIDGISGAVTNTPSSVVRKGAGMFPVNVTNTSSLIVGGNSLREWLLIQNKSLTGTMWFGFLVSGPVTTTNGIRLLPGESFVSDAICPTTNVFAIGDLPSNPDVIVALC